MGDRQILGAVAVGHGQVALAADLLGDLLDDEITMSPAVAPATRSAVTPVADCNLSPSTVASTMATLLSLALNWSTGGNSFSKRHVFWPGGKWPPDSGWSTGVFRSDRAPAKQRPARGPAPKPASGSG